MLSASETKCLRWAYALEANAASVLHTNIDITLDVLSPKTIYGVRTIYGVKTIYGVTRPSTGSGTDSMKPCSANVDSFVSRFNDKSKCVSHIDLHECDSS